MLRPSAPLKTLGERNEKSRNQIRRNRLWKKNFRSHTDRFKDRMKDNSFQQQKTVLAIY
ncbi:hypothetical protein LEP1GSC021_3700 [Leptospira noguchii str. 1993005606]|nr:hypothetical protein LEP1GSC021_3700 [Leptospira noguchii str. 1993005606]